MGVWQTGPPGGVRSGAWHMNVTRKLGHHVGGVAKQSITLFLLRQHLILGKAIIKYLFHARQNLNLISITWHQAI